MKKRFNELVFSLLSSNEKGIGMEMKEDIKNTKSEIIREYREEVMKLVKYISWLDSKKGQSVVKPYDGAQGQVCLPLVIYDSVLLSLVKEAKKSKLMVKNYFYDLRRRKIETVQDEWDAIEKAKIEDFHILQSIFSKYITEGMSKAVRWDEGVQHEIFLRVLVKMRDLVEIGFTPKDDYLVQNGLSLIDQIKQLNEKHNVPK